MYSSNIFTVLRNYSGKKVSQPNFSIYSSVKEAIVVEEVWLSVQMMIVINDQRNNGMFKTMTDSVQQLYDTRDSRSLMAQTTTVPGARKVVLLIQRLWVQTQLGHNSQTICLCWSRTNINLSFILVVILSCHSCLV